MFEAFDKIAKEFGYEPCGDIYLREEFVGGYYEPIYEIVEYSRKQVADEIINYLHCCSINIDD